MLSDNRLYPRVGIKLYVNRLSTNNTGQKTLEKRDTRKGIPQNSVSVI
jgi:hypothetical protein